MKTLKLTISLQDDLVLSQTSATAGTHESLDYIPGATLLGALANELYNDIGEQAWSLFHSGAVRYGHGFPLDSQRHIGYATPFSLHHKKDDKNAQLNLLMQKPQGADQMKQMRGGYLTQQAKRIQPDKHYSMRTAINPDTQRAADGQLYGYQALRAGQVFCSHIQCDQQDDYDILLSFFAKHRQLRLGRSRSAQFGRVRIDIAPDNTSASQWTLQNNQLILWLASELCAQTLDGQPTLQPSGIEIGLTQGRLNLEKSFIRTRRYSAFNAARRHYDLERQVISAGSVLVYDMDQALSEQDQARLEQGLGILREQGLGQLVPAQVTQAILLAPTVPPIRSAALAHYVTTAPIPQNSVLIKNLQSFAQQGQEIQRARAAADQAINTLIVLYRSARNFNGLADGLPCGPSKAQWDRVRGEAENNLDATWQTIISRIQDTQNGVCKPGDADWGLSTGDKTHPNFSAWLEAQVKEYGNAHNNISDFLRMLAHKVSQHPVINQLHLGQTDHSEALA